MNSFTRLAFALVYLGVGLAACSSNPTSNKGDDDDDDDDGISSGATSSRGGSDPGASGSSPSNSAGSGTTPNGGSGSSVGGGTESNGGSAPQTGGTAATGGNPPVGGGASGGAANAGAGGQSGGTGPGGGNGGASGSGPLPPYVATCAPQKYTPTATPGAACETTFVPEVQLIAGFEGEGVAPGWGVYPNVDGKTGFTPATATPAAGGANETTQALAFKVTNLQQGIKVQVGFGTQCQDVRTFKGISFWAKGNIDGATQPFIVTANTLVVQLGGEKTLLGGCQGAGCVAAPPDKRVSISAEWREYRIPFDCFGDGKVFDGYYTTILFNAFGPNSNFAIDEVGYY